MKNWEEDRKKIIGLGENSFKKSYYPELQNKIDELEDSSNNMQQILNSISDAILIHDFEGKILYFNEQAYVFCNIKEEDLFKYNVVDFSSKDMPIEALPQMWNEVSKGKGMILEWNLIQQGTLKEFPVQVSINPIHWKGIPAIIAVIRDFTEQKRAERVLIEKNNEIACQNDVLKQLNEELFFAKEKAIESDRLKMAFLANISHEIRTPLTGILGFSQLLSMPDIGSDEQKEFIEIINNCGVQLMTIIDDIIEIAKIEANQIKMESKELNINDLIYEVEALHKEKALKAKLDFIYTKEFDDEDAIIVSDSAKIRQILINLISNALKFTHEGYIKFGYQKVEDELLFYVEDSGIGIEKNMQEVIFNRFTQVETEFSKMTGGTGLGLSISKALAEMLGGKIWVESEFGKGSTFYFTIPYMSSKMQPEYIKESEMSVVNKNDRKTILVAEDEYYNYLLVKRLLIKEDLDVLHVTNGLDAIDAVKNNPSIALVLMDMKMPQMDGRQATIEIKSIRNDLPIIAQTAYALDADKRKFLESGCDDYIAKPYKSDDFICLIRKYIC